MESINSADLFKKIPGEEKTYQDFIKGSLKDLLDMDLSLMPSAQLSVLYNMCRVIGKKKIPNKKTKICKVCNTIYEDDDLLLCQECGSHKYYEVDTPFADSISLLNKKGYVTERSSAGRVLAGNDSVKRGFIVFDSHYECDLNIFKSLPLNWRGDMVADQKCKGLCLILQDCGAFKDMSYPKTLQEWVEGLPTVTVLRKNIVIPRSEVCN